MAPATRDRLADLGDFLAALRTNGLPVGPGEIERLRWLFRRKPHLDRDDLKALLSALLVKTREHGETFEALFADWCPDREADWPDEAEPMHLEADRQTQPSTTAAQADLHEDEREPQPHRPWWLWPGLIAAVLLAAALLWLGWPLKEQGGTFVEPDVPTKTVSARKKR